MRDRLNLSFQEEQTAFGKSQYERRYNSQRTNTPKPLNMAEAEDVSMREAGLEAGARS